MQFAIVDGQRMKPAKGLRGTCACCESVVIAKCGQFKVHHWSHLSLRNCDQWWENETEWHRNWKNYFDESCHEIILIDQETKEKHIADIKTANGTIIEFQHSPITEEERLSREAFYLSFTKHMVWVLDCRRDDILANFQLGMPGGKITPNMDMQVKHWGRSKLYEKWHGSKAFVLLDFGGNSVWWLKHYHKETNTVIVNPRFKAAFLQKQGVIIK